MKGKFVLFYPKTFFTFYHTECQTCVYSMISSEQWSSEESQLIAEMMLKSPVS